MFRQGTVKWYDDSKHFGFIEEDGEEKEKVIHRWNLLPESEAKPFPEYIPAPLRDDYHEACLIKSKKSSTWASRLYICVNRFGPEPLVWSFPIWNPTRRA